MKTIEELAVDESTTLVADILPQRILDQVNVAARASRKAISLVKVNRDLVGAKGRSIIVPSRGQLAAVAVGEGATPTTASVTYTTTTITPTKVGLGVRISQEAIDGVQLDVINDLINESGEALAEAQDKAIITIFTTANAVYTTIGSATAGKLTYEDILTARTSVSSQNYAPNILFINPDQQSDLLNMTKFIDASQYGTNAPIMNGEIGKIAGLSILVSQNDPSGKALVVDSSKAAILAVKRDIDLKRWDAAATDSTELYFYEEYAGSVINPKAVAIITNA
jgi:N4-gp56 family major capsid protein